MSHSKKGVIVGLDKVAATAAKTSLSALTFGFGLFESALGSVYAMYERQTQAFGKLGQAMGGGTADMNKMNNAAWKLYQGPLGSALGMSIGEAAAEIGSFNTSIGMLDESMTKDQGTLIAHAAALGMTSSEAGEAAKSYRLMGLDGADLEKTLKTLKGDTAKLGAQSAGLSKNLLVAGKNLLAMAGPKFQKQMTETIDKMYKLGVSAQTLEKFTDLTDTFDQTATSMAKLNTMFGLHLNALDIFAEEDPAKRWAMISKQIQQTGRSMSDMSRTEKKVMADALHLSMDELNALANPKLAAANEKREKSWEEMYHTIQSTLVNWNKSFDKVITHMVSAFRPLFAAFGLTGAQTKDLSSIVEGVADKISDAFDGIADNGGFQLMLYDIAEDIREIGKTAMTWLSGDGLQKDITDFVKGFKDIPKEVSSVAKLLVGENGKDGILGNIGAAIGFMAKNAEWFIGLWAGAKLVGAISAIATAFGALDIVLSPILGTALAISAAIAAAAAIGIGGAYLATSGMREDADQMHRFNEAGKKTDAAKDAWQKNPTIDNQHAYANANNIEQRLFNNLSPEQIASIGVTPRPMINYQTDDTIVTPASAPVASQISETTPGMVIPDARPTTTSTNSGGSGGNHFTIYVDGVLSHSVAARVVSTRGH